MATFILYHTADDEKFLPLLKPMLIGHRTVLRKEIPLSATQIEIDFKNTGAVGCMSTSPLMLQMCLGWKGRKQPSLNDFFGSIISLNRKLEPFKNPMEVLFLNPLMNIVTTNAGRFLFSRFISKLTSPDKWFFPSEFIWDEITPQNFQEVLKDVQSAEMVAVDIETDRERRAITLCSWTSLRWDKHGIPVTMSWVLEIKDTWAVAAMRTLNATPPQKVLQNGKYDSAFFFRYSAPLYNYMWDTINAMHCWYSELPKRLDFTAAFLLRNVQFWKDEGKTGNRTDALRYNARDGWATLNTMLSWFRDAPEWALENYRQEFPIVFPCHLSEMQGIWIDRERMAALKTRKQQELVALEATLNKMLGTKNFNPGSPLQVLNLMRVLMALTLNPKEIKSSKEIELKKVMFRHPLAGRILQLVIDIRERRKLISTYLNEEKLWNGKLLYTLNPHGTDTARLASAESHYEYGWQIQNNPRDEEYKEIFLADDGFNFGEGDYEQAEARDTGYLSGDTNLIAATDSGKDYHSVNAERFFGVSYSSIIDETGRVLLKPLRDLAKRTNHGANYNMGAYVLIDTMGLDKIFAAARLLNLPWYYTAKQIAEHLLAAYDLAYPTVRHKYYDDIKHRVLTTSMLVSPLGWTRFCFGDPIKSKSDLNALVAHPSQNLNAGTLNRAYMRIFREVALQNIHTYRLNAQIHDSVLFQYRIGHEYLIQKTADCMILPTPVTDIYGKTRTLIVPVGMKAGAKTWGELKSWKLEKPTGQKDHS